MKLFTFLLATLLLSAQNADVTILTTAESKAARDAYNDLKKAEKHWSDVSAGLKSMYHITYEAEFSRDFTALVPKATDTSASRSCWPYWGITNTPLTERSTFFAPNSFAPNNTIGMWEYR